MYPSSVILKLFLGKSLKKKLSLCSGLGLVISGLITLAPNAIDNSETCSETLVLEHAYPTLHDTCIQQKKKIYKPHRQK